MKKIFIISLSLLMTFSVSGQKGVEAINGFKYAFVNQSGGSYDQYGITKYLRDELSKKGLIVLGYTASEWPSEAKNNRCLICSWESTYSAGGVPNSAKASFIVKNCKNEIVFENSSWASHFGSYYPQNTRLAMEKAFSPIQSFNYRFNQNVTPKFEFPTVETTTENEQTLKIYFENNKLDPIEGIYKAYQTEEMSYYKIAIKKREDKFIAIIIESKQEQWKEGEVKAYFEQSSIKGLYSVKWYMADKTPYETFGNMENEALLSIEFKDSKSDVKKKENYVKMFPTASSNATYKRGDSKASGSGFFLTTDGILATNAHVIEDAKSIEVSVANEIGTISYKAKVLLVDTKNDVALIKIDDETFEGLTALPYGISEIADVGESVFTIGYPLNDVMGTNYKVNDGIISAKTGIEDDIRYYQISVPLQPGNSGGPLFNRSGNIIGITSAKLNGEAIGTEIQNVNYAIKSSYLITLYKMLPEPIKLTETSQGTSKELQDQVKAFKNYVCLIRIF